MTQRRSGSSARARPDDLLRDDPLLEGCDPTQVVRIGQSLADFDVAETQVKALSDSRSKLLRNALEAVPPPNVPPGNPVRAHLREDRTAEGLVVCKRFRASAGSSTRGLDRERPVEPLSIRARKRVEAAATPCARRETAGRR